MSFRDRIDIEALLQVLGIEYERRGANLTARCPNPDHIDANPSWTIVDAPGTKKHGGHGCFPAEVKVITSQGVRSIGDISGTTQRVLTVREDGYPEWVDAPFRSFGVQRLWKLTVRRNGVRKTIRTTANHRWFVRTSGEGGNPITWGERLTERLVPGHTLRSAVFPRPGKCVVSPWGVPHGFTFGDGTLTRRRGVHRGARVQLWGKKDEALLKFFPLSPKRVDRNEFGTQFIEIGGLPSAWKSYPSLEETHSYLYGWLAGYFAADGCVDRRGLPTLASARREHLEFVERICIRLGIFTHGIRMQMRLGVGAEPTPMYALTFSRSSLSMDFFLLERHRRRWLAGRVVRERRRWVVESVEPTDEFEEVFCATVPDTHSFALEGNILTGNCFACAFAGGPWELVMAVRGLDEEGAAKYIGAFVAGRPRRFEGIPTVRVRLPNQAPEYQIPSAVHIPSIDGGEWPRVFSDYLTKRNVTPAQVIQWRMGYATRGRLAWRVVIPVHTRGRLVAHVARAIFADRERYDMPWSSSGALPNFAVLGEPLLDPTTKCVTIAEGSFSMLALDRVGAPNPVAILGSDWSVQRAAVLSAYRWEHVLIATDPDAAGDRVARSIEATFRHARISRIRLGQSPDDAQPEELRDAVQAALAS